MIKIVTQAGDLLSVKSGHIVHGCNAQGIMGAGVARAVRQSYPYVYDDYRREYELNGLFLGKAYSSTVSPDLMLWNAITQEGFDHPVRNVSYDAIETCFAQINEHIHLGIEGISNMQPDEVHIPAIGSGIGGGNWEIIREIIEQTMDFPTTLWVIPTPIKF